MDGAIRRIERTYDDMSRLATITSYDAASGGNVANQVAYSYSGYQLASVVRQDSPVNASTPEVRYNYDDGLLLGSMAGEARFVRLSSVEYPGGRVVQEHERGRKSMKGDAAQFDE